MKTARALLLVEDNEDDVLLMKLALKRAGIINPLHVVEDGQLAINYLAGKGSFAEREQHPLPVVIFLDLKLPLKSGHEVLAWIRQESSLQDMIVIILTSSNQPVDLQEAYRLGANSYVVKPPTAEQLGDLARAFRWYWLQYNEFVQADGIAR
jgi:CheY-like chemotaxis protein